MDLKIELICGISRWDEILKLKDPTLDELVVLGKCYDTSAKIQKANFGEEAKINKVSDYQKSKNDKKQQGQDK